MLAGCAGLFQRSRPDVPQSYEVHAQGQLRVGSAEADITPAGVQYMGGYNIGRTSTGVHSQLMVRALVLLMGEQRFAIVGIDNLGLQREDADWVKRGVGGFPNGNVLLCSSHTHAGPDLIGMWGSVFFLSGRDTDYLRLVREGVAQAVADALAAARPARLVCGFTRLPDKIAENRNRRGLYNRRFTVLQALDQENDQPLGTLLHLACHPEMFRRKNTLISADMVGGLCDAWKEAGLGQAVFVNGELGAMVTPAFHPKGAAGIPLLAKKLVELGRRALASGGPLAADDILLRRRDVYLPLQSTGLTFARLTMVIPRELYDGCIRSSVGYMRIGSLEAICVPGEMEPALAARIRAAARRPDLLIFGLVD
ncbi:MAG: neutral/alkaline non-lysosomal ceramidase N-terminal domain-containing protein, partial [Planctomycetota bacterium]